MWDLWNPPQLAVQNRENCQEQTQQPSWSHGLPWEAHWYVVSQPSITLLICIRGLCSDDLNPRLLVAALFMLQKNVCCQNRQCPTHFCTATRSDLWTRSVRGTLAREFCKTVSHSARRPVMTCLGALLSPWLMQAICDIWMQTRRRGTARGKHAAVTLA